MSEHTTVLFIIMIASIVTAVNTFQIMALLRDILKVLRMTHAPAEGG